MEIILLYLNKLSVRAVSRAQKIRKRQSGNIVGNKKWRGTQVAERAVRGKTARDKRKNYQ